jgi:hypothetical protein
MVVAQAMADHDPVMATRAGMDHGPGTVAVGLVKAGTVAVAPAGVRAGMAVRGQAPVINLADHPVAAGEAQVRVPVGTAIRVEGAVDINQAQAQAARVAATCARTAISGMAAMVGRAVGTANG